MSHPETFDLIHNWITELLVVIVNRLLLKEFEGPRSQARSVLMRTLLENYVRDFQYNYLWFMEGYGLIIGARVGGLLGRAYETGLGRKNSPAQAGTWLPKTSVHSSLTLSYF